MSIFYCNHCHNAFDNRYSIFKKDVNNEYMCPIYSCPGTVFEVDELMLESIKTLNEKGYYTISHCSGHVVNNNNPYIAFGNSYIKFDNLPSGWYIDDSIIRYRLTTQISTPERMKEIADCNGEFLKFCKSLPNIIISSPRA